MYIPSKQLAEDVIKSHGSPCYLTDKSTIRNRVRQMKEAFGQDISIFYAIKANYNPKIVSYLKECGIDGIDTVSPLEIELAKSLGFNNYQIIFTGNNSSSAELSLIHEEGIILNIGSISELSRFCNAHPESKISIRINPDIGEGEFKGIITGGENSKFGLIPDDLDTAQEIISKNHMKLVGIHCHIGSGIYSTDKFQQALSFMEKMVTKFKPTEFVNLGGGFGVRYSHEAEQIDLNSFGKIVQEFIKNIRFELANDIKIILEPGKFLVAESTCLLTKVTNVKKNEKVIFIGTDTGMNHIMRPMLYGAKHEIVNLSDPQFPSTPLFKNDISIKTSSAIPTKIQVSIVGNICESTDVIAEGLLDIERIPKEGDILCILTAGAYCSSMSSLYNMRPYATEVITDGQGFELTRKKIDLKTMIDGLGFCM